MRTNQSQQLLSYNNSKSLPSLRYYFYFYLSTHNGQFDHLWRYLSALIGETKYLYGAWSNCNSTCSPGMQSRVGDCVYAIDNAPSTDCNPLQDVQVRQTCSSSAARLLIILTCLTSGVCVDNMDIVYFTSMLYSQVVGIGVGYSFFFGVGLLCTAQLQGYHSCAKLYHVLVSV